MVRVAPPVVFAFANLRTCADEAAFRSPCLWNMLYVISGAVLISLVPFILLVSLSALSMAAFNLPSGMGDLLFLNWGPLQASNTTVKYSFLPRRQSLILTSFFNSYFAHLSSFFTQSRQFLGLKKNKKKKVS